jgi:hypothetical protein
MQYHVVGRGFDAYEGRRVFVTWMNLPELGVQAAVVGGGAVELAVGPVDGGRGALLLFYVDLDGDEHCGTEEISGSAFVTDIDLMSERFDYLIEPKVSAQVSSSRYCSYFTPSQ